MGWTTEKSGALCSRVSDFHLLQHQDQTGSRLLAQWAPGTYFAVKNGLIASSVEVKNVELYLQSSIRLHSAVLHYYLLFVNFWPVRNPEKLTGGPTLYVMCLGHSICTAQSANPPTLSPYLALWRPPPPPANPQISLVKN
jgi:hypothetical protein